MIKQCPRHTSNKKPKNNKPYPEVFEDIEVLKGFDGEHEYYYNTIK
jgi:hypothetical protein